MTELFERHTSQQQPAPFIKS